MATATTGSQALSKSTTRTLLPCAAQPSQNNNFGKPDAPSRHLLYCSEQPLPLMVVFSRFKAVLLLLAVFPLSGCLFHTHRVEQNPAISLKAATKEELLKYINTQAGKIQSMQATVDIDTSVGGAKKGKNTEYQHIRGYVLARKPAMLRMIGLLPILRNTAFDMVSDGREFKVSIPPKNRFVVGRNDLVTPNPQQPLENLRPQV